MAFFGKIKGKRLLDLGCGTGRDSLFFAEAGADVTALDVSSEAIRRVELYHHPHIQAVLGSLDDLPDIPFDLIFGSLILHHLEPFAEVASRLSALLGPGGRAFFLENNGDVPLLMWCRRNLVGRFGIEKASDDFEYPLTSGEIGELRKYFRVDVRTRDMYLLSLASLYLIKGHMADLCAKVDKWLLKNHLLTNCSYLRDITLTKGTYAS